MPNYQTSKICRYVGVHDVRPMFEERSTIGIHELEAETRRHFTMSRVVITTHLTEIREVKNKQTQRFSESVN